MLGPEALQLFRDLRHYLRQATGKQRSFQFLLEHVSVAVQREPGACRRHLSAKKTVPLADEGLCGRNVLLSKIKPSTLSLAKSPCHTGVQTLSLFERLAAFLRLQPLKTFLHHIWYTLPAVMSLTVTSFLTKALSPYHLKRSGDKQPCLKICLHLEAF